MAHLSNEPKISKSGRSKQKTRHDLYLAGCRQRKFALRENYLDRLDSLKAAYKIKSRDTVVSRLVRKANVLFEARELNLPSRNPGEPTKQIVVSLHREHLIFLDEIVSTHKGATMGQALEALIQIINNLEPAPMQLTMPL